MTARNLTLMVPQILQEAPGCLESVALDAVVKAATEFFTRTGVWRYDMDPEQIAESTYEYDLLPPDDTNVTMVHSILHNGRPVVSKSVEWLNTNWPNWRTAEGSQIRYYFQQSRDVVRVVPIPDVTDSSTLDIRLVVAPTRSATTLDEEKFDTYEDEILFGAKARIFRMPNKAWTDKHLADEYDDLFEKAIVDGRIAANKDMTNTVLTIASVPFN